jgi:DNA-binding transcriptional LysR family regulator
MGHYDNLEFRHLKYVIAIVEEGTFTAAAQRIPVAQSALSKQIKEIEDVYEIRIFSRDRDGYRDGSKLTPAGQVLLGFAHRLIDLRMEVIQTVQALHQGTLLPLRLGFSAFVDKQLLGAVVQAHRDIFPTTELIPECGDTEDLLRRMYDDELDAALVTLPVNDTKLHVQEIQHKNLVVCIRTDDPLAEMDSIPPALLSGLLSVFCDPRHHPLAHQRLMTMLKEVGIQPRGATPNFNLEHVQWMVKEKLCYALVAEGSKLQGELTTRPIEGTRWTIDSAFIYRDNTKHPAVSLLGRELDRLFVTNRAVNGKKPPVAASRERMVQGELELGNLIHERTSRAQIK